MPNKRVIRDSKLRAKLERLLVLQNKKQKVKPTAVILETGVETLHTEEIQPSLQRAEK